MHFQKIKTLCAIAALTALCRLALQAGAVQLSFLGDEAVVQDTVRLLTNNGCTQQAALIYKQAVQRYFLDPLDFDLSKFPKPQQGFYFFATSEKLIAALPHNIFDSDHKLNFNCFDTAIILASGQFKTELHPDDIAGPFLVTSMFTNNQIAIFPTATPRDAFTHGYSSYGEDANRFVPKPMQEDRICLTAALFRCYMLPLSTTEETLNTQAISVLRAAWRRDGLKFPDRFEFILCHYINLRQHAIVTEHAGLLFRKDKGYTYLEKAGISGPFLRLDFENRADLMPWLAAMFSWPGVQNSHYVTFNDTRIEKLDTFQKIKNSKPEH